MAVIKEILRTNEDGSISFGNYELEEKTKLSDHPFLGDIYKVKTFREITKLERNEMFVYESVPGTAVFDLVLSDNGMSFCVEGDRDAQITVGLKAETAYEVIIDGDSTGTMKTNLGGKLSFSVELEKKESKVEVIIRKCEA